MGAFRVATIDGVTMQDMQEQMGRFRALIPTGPVAARLECGEAAWNTLRSIAPPPDLPPYQTRPLADLAALPIVTRPDMAPDVWRLVDTDGQVMQAGTLGVGWERDVVDMGNDGTGWASVRPGAAHITW